MIMIIILAGHRVIKSYRRGKVQEEYMMMIKHKQEVRRESQGTSVVILPTLTVEYKLN